MNNQDIIQIIGISFSFIASLTALYFSWQANRIAKEASQKMRDSDYAALSDCYAALLKLRNAFRAKLPLPKLAQQHLYKQTAVIGDDALRNVSIARRIVGQVWADELVSATVESALLAEKLSEINFEKVNGEPTRISLTPTNLDLLLRRRQVADRLEKLLVELDDKMKRF